MAKFISGIVYTNIKSEDESGYLGEYINNINDIQILNNNQILVSDYSNSLILARYNANGSLDTHFGNKGSVIKYTSEYGREHYDRFLGFGIHLTDILNDGRILIAGNDDPDPSGEDRSYSLVFSYHAEGSQDNNFGLQGSVGIYNRILSIQSENNDKIIFAGFMYIHDDNDLVSSTDFALTRCNADGSIDTNFGNQGRVTTDINLGSYDKIDTIQVLSNSKILAAGHSNNDFALVQYNSDGTIDTDFGNQGIVITDLHTNAWSSISAIQIVELN